MYQNVGQTKTYQNGIRAVVKSKADKGERVGTTVPYGYRRDPDSGKNSELARAESRIADLKALFKRLYEDNVLGRISDEQFRMLSSDYEDEQKTLNEKIPVLETEIERLKSECTNVQRFLDISEKYTDITELSPELLRTFVNKIVIYEREKKHDKNAPQQIDIYYRYIGSMCGTGEETESDS